MRMKSVGGVLVAALTAAMSVAVPAAPAHADLDDFFEDVIDAVEDIANGGGGGGGGGPDPELEAAKREILAAVNSAKQEILDHIDGITNAEVRSCTEAAVITLSDMDNPPPDFLLGPALNSAVRCSTDSVELFDTVQNLAIADDIGKLMGVIHALTIAGFAKLGLPVTDLVANLVRGYDKVVARLAPTFRCVQNNDGYDPELPRPRPGDVMYWSIHCAAYNGDTGSFGLTTIFPSGPTEADFGRAMLAAGRNTSYTPAASALPRLRALL